MTEELSRVLPNVENGAAKPPTHPQRSIEEVEAQADASLAKRDQIKQAEQLAETADRQGQMELFLMENEMFGYEPYSEEVMASLTALLLEMEGKLRRVRPEYDITKGWNKEQIQSYLKREYVERVDLKEDADSDEAKDNQYANAERQIREKYAPKSVDNLTLCRELVQNYQEAVPPEELAKLQAFIQIQSFASTPEDAAIVTAKINALSFDGGIPNPRLFIETNILSDESLSESYRETVAKHFDIPNPRIKTGGQVDQTLDARDPDGKPLYTAANPVEIGKNTLAYEKPDGSRAVLVSTDGRADREIPWNRGDAPDVIGTKISLAKIWARNEWDGSTDFFGESVDIETDILSQTDPHKLTKVRNVINAIFGGTRGYDGVIVQDHEADFLGWFNQHLAVKGDAAQGDYDKDTALTNRINLGIHPNGEPNQIDYEVLRAAALYTKGQFGQGEPDYFQLQEHLHDLFPEKDIPLTGENAQEAGFTS